MVKVGIVDILVHTMNMPGSHKGRLAGENIFWCLSLVLQIPDETHTLGLEGKLSSCPLPNGQMAKGSFYTPRFQQKFTSASLVVVSLLL